MRSILENTKWVMLVPGVLTSTILLDLFAPKMVLESMFAVSIEGQMETQNARSWSALVGIIGCLLIIGCYRESLRYLTSLATTASKMIFITIRLLFGQQYLFKAPPTLATNFILVLVALVYFYAVNNVNSEPKSV